jgi:23S rRNA pseudouridine1911/1915/1917 synthase
VTTETLSPIASEATGVRLDRFLADHLGLPRNQIQQWIRAGRVRIDGHPAKGSHHLTAGETLEWEPLERDNAAEMTPEPGELTVLHEEDSFVVLNKPAGLTVHPGAGRSAGTLAHRLLAHYPEIASVGGPGRPGIVHRLDKDTSGIMVVARTPAAYQKLTTAFAERQTDKRYLAIVYGRPKTAAGTIDKPIARHPQRRKEMSVVPGGRPATTGYRVLETADGISILEIHLTTGRTHQIRVHLKALGHPLVGDPTYGEARWKGLPKNVQQPLRDFPRPALHAWKLGFAHPVSGAALSFEAPVPEDLMRLWVEVTGRGLEGLGA